MNKLKLNLFLSAILLPGIFTICPAQNTPQDNAFAAIEKAEQCLYKCKDLECLEAAVREYEQIRAANPRAGIKPMRKMQRILRNLREKCSERAVAALSGGGGGGTTGTQIKIMTVEQIQGFLAMEDYLKADIIFVKTRLEQTNSQLKEFRKQKKASRTDGENLKPTNDREKELLDKSDALRADLKEKKELYNEAFGLKMKLTMWFYKTAVKLKILKS